MADEIHIGDLTFAPGVLETIVTLAAKDVEGVADIVGSQKLPQLTQRAVNKQPARSVEVDVEQDRLHVSLHVEVEYGQPLREVGQAVQKAVFEAVTHQVGVPVDSVDVYIDEIEFTG